MPTVKQDRTLQARHNRDMLYLGLPFLLVVLATVLLSTWLWNPYIFVAGWCTAVPIAIVGIVRQMRRYLRFPCPTCGAVLQRSDKGEAETPITFLCKACDTEWDTGFINSRGD
jgi:predicted RNA-binding Zn-ribbon protein involved in translation (DUF1610 family)